MRRISSQALVLFAMAGLATAGLAEDAPLPPVETHTVETPGLPPIQVFVGDAAEAASAAERHERKLAAQRTAEEAARIAAAEPEIEAPEYPAHAPVVASGPAITIPLDPAPLTGLHAAPSARADADSAEVVMMLRAILAKAEAYGHRRLTRAQRDEIAGFYAARDFRPLWNDGRGLTARGEGVLKALLAAGDDGLDVASYQIERPAVQADAQALAVYEFQLSQAAVLYARDAQGGRIDARRLSNLIDPDVAFATPSEVLGELVEANDPGTKLESYNPPHAGYRALREQLSRLRLASAAMSPAKGEPVVTDSAESQRHVSTTGRRGRTAALATAASRGEADIVANMERWRWLPRDLGEKHIFVNIPEYRVRVMERGAVRHEARAIVGKPESQTPIFSDRMQFLVVNPSWFVPPSILKKEFLPKLAQDPTYAERRGYQVIRRGSQIYVKQPPGERNALGHIKFMFPNRHAVYLHDTPSRGLFGAERRAFSHGCVRVDKPFQLAEMVLGPDTGWTESRVRGLVGRGEQSVKLAAPLPVHLTYFTTFVDDLGRLETRDDIYGHNRRVKAALGLE